MVDTTSHSGTHSLRFTYDAKNDFCNTCGTAKYVQKNGVDNALYFVADPNIHTITDLTTQDFPNTKLENDGPGAKPGRIIFNKNNGFSTWEILSVVNDTVINDKLTLKLVKPGIGGETPRFNSGDEVFIARQCGVDGHIGGNINRRSDCNNVINWFYIRSTTTQGPGDSIFRRQYLKPEVISPQMHQKLHYFRADDRGPNKNAVVLFADSKSSDDIVPIITNFDKIGGNGLYKPGFGLPEDLLFERAVWHYVEEEYKAATLNLGYDDTIDPALNPDNPNIHRYHADGAYRLWMSKSGEEDTVGATPVLEVLNLRFAPINGGGGTDISFWGNMQHNIHLRGNWYIDDVYISDQKVGKAIASGNNVSPPAAPTITTH